MSDTTDIVSPEDSRALVAALVDGATEDAIATLDDVSPLPYVDPKSIPCRFSLLREMAKSAAHYEFAAQQPQNDDSLSAKLGGLARTPDRRDALRFGAAVHLLLLDDPKRIAVYGGKVRNGKVWDAFEMNAKLAGKAVILNTKEYAQARAVANALRRHRRSMDLLFDGEGAIVEDTITWDYCGRRFRSTPDSRHRGHRCIVDLKTTVSAEPRQFARHALKLCYHAQAALYGLAVQDAEQWDPSDYFLVAVEKTGPMPIQIYRLTDAAILAGHKLVRAWTEMVLNAEASGQYPAYAESDLELDVPRYEDDMPDLVFGDVEILEPVA